MGVPPQKEYSYFTRFARTEFHLPKANFTRDAYLTAEGDFTAASAARGAGSAQANGFSTVYRTIKSDRRFSDGRFSLYYRDLSCVAAIAAACYELRQARSYLADVIEMQMPR